MKDNAGTGMLERVQDFVLDRPAGDMPEAVLRRAGYLMLDTLGICAAAGPMDAGRIGRETAALLFGAGTPGTAARMLFDGRQVSLAGAVFAAANQLDNLDGHDGYNPTKGHIGLVTVPTLAVLAEKLGDLGGRDALAALVVGYEIAGRAGIALHATVSDYHTSGAWNALGVAAMAARLRGQSRAQLRESLGIAEFWGPRSQMMREIATPTMLHDGSAFGAMAGMTAAILAEQGFTGAPAVTVEAPEAAAFWQDLGTFWQVEHQYIKPYPTCRWTHAAVDAVRELCAEHGLVAGDIAEVRIRSFDYALALWPDMPETTSKAQYGLPFPVAVMIVHGRIGLEHISGAGLQDAEVARLVRATKLIREPRHEARYPEGRWADVDLVLTDGRVLASGDVHARGGPERPFSEADIVAKYMEFAEPALGTTRAAGLRDAVLGLAEGAPFSEVARLLYDPL